MRRVLGLLIAIALAFPVAVSADPPCSTQHPCPPPGPVEMGRLVTAGAETNNTSQSNGSTGNGVEPIVSGGAGGSIDSTFARSGSRSFSSVASLAFGTWTGALGTTYYGRTYFYKNASFAPAADLQLVYFVDSGGGQLGALKYQTDGTLILKYGAVPGTQVGSASAVLADGQWYRLELSILIGTGSIDAIEGRIDGASFASGSSLGISDSVPATFRIQAGSSANAWFDDLAVNDSSGANQNSWPGDGKVVLLLPVTDNATGTGWNLGTNTAPGGAGHTALGNTPPVGVADLAVGSDPKQMRNATSNANVNVDMNMTTYAAAGIGPNATVNVIVPIVSTAAPVTTSAKAGTVGVVSNPAIANISLGAQGTSGAFWQGNAAGTFPAGWKTSYGTTTYAPAITPSTAPVMRVTQVTSSTRIAMVCFMGMYVDYSEGPLPYLNVMPPMIIQ